MMTTTPPPRGDNQNGDVVAALGTMLEKDDIAGARALLQRQDLFASTTAATSATDPSDGGRRLETASITSTESTTIFHVLASQHPLPAATITSEPAPRREKSRFPETYWVVFSAIVSGIEGCASPEQRCQMDSHDTHGLTPLMLCAESNNYHMCAHLLSKRVSIVSKDANGSTALMRAATAGSADVLEQLMRVPELTPGVFWARDSVSGQCALDCALQAMRGDNAIPPKSQCLTLGDLGDADWPISHLFARPDLFLSPPARDYLATAAFAGDLVAVKVFCQYLQDMHLAHLLTYDSKDLSKTATFEEHVIAARKKRDLPLNFRLEHIRGILSFHEKRVRGAFCLQLEFHRPPASSRGRLSDVDEDDATSTSSAHLHAYDLAEHPLPQGSSISSSPPPLPPQPPPPESNNATVTANIKCENEPAVQHASAVKEGLMKEKTTENAPS